MKTISTVVIFYLAFLFATPSFAQQVTFQKSFTSETDYFVQQNLLMPGNGSLIIGQQVPYSSCIKLDELGNVIWSKNFYIDSLTHLHDPRSVITADGGFLFSARIDSPQKNSTYYDGAVIVKCNKKGNVVWSKKITSKIFPILVPKLMYENKKRELLLVYTSGYDDPDHNSRFQVLKINKDGDLLWLKTFSAGVDYNPKDIVQANDEVYLAGETYDEYSYLSTCDLLCLNAYNGEFINLKNLYSNYRLSFTSRYSITKLVFANQKLTAFGTLYKTIIRHENVPFFFVYPITDSTTMRATVFDTSLFTLQRFLKGYKDVLPIQLTSYNYIKKDAAFVNFYYSEKKEIMLDQFDSLGRICPYFENPLIHQPWLEEKIKLIGSYSLYQTVADSVYLTNKKINYDTSIKLVQTSICEGSSGSQSNLKEKIFQAETNKHQPILFPNPVENILYIQNLQDEKSILTIINSVGVVIQRVTAHNKDEKIVVNKLQSGVYYLRIQYDGKSETYRFIKK